MKKLVLFLLLMVVSSFNLFAAEEQEGIHWFHGTFAEARQESLTQNKVLFVDFYATWCGPCKFMMNQVFPKSEIYNYINEHFVAYKVDVDEDGDSAAEHMVKGIPTLLFLNADEAGTELKRLVGSRPAEKFLVELKSIIEE